MTATTFTLMLMRGCSGSGKSTLVKQIVAEWTASAPIGVFSTDDFWLTPVNHPDGTQTMEYRHDISKLSEAHKWNQQRAQLAMESKSHPLIIIDNTNLQKWEAKPYVECAVRCGYEVVVKEPTTPWWVAKDVDELFKRGTHGVPLEAIARMVERYEPDFTVDSILKSSPPFNRGSGDRGGRRGGPGGLNNRGGISNRGNWNSQGKEKIAINGNASISNGSSFSNAINLSNTHSFIPSRGYSGPT
ncbi:hypothetical protein BDR26DRAFT_914360 [Obelidium mucronatum]|nr:hypothetical protein BDR26DRAFT_914360 [Obelidium mucronatum]